MLHTVYTDKTANNWRGDAYCSRFT